MKFEEAAALKILFGSEEVQVVTLDDPIPGDGPIEGIDGLGVIVRDHGVNIHDHVLWYVESAIAELSEYYNG